METYLLDWANLLVRWVHVITAIAWIGSSIYFVFLDSSLTPPTARDLVDKGVGGELWAVHGGGFYNPQKYLVAPATLPPHLHWFYWESYSTWLSGFALFTLTYLWNAGSYLLDNHLTSWSAGTAVAVAMGLLVAFWVVYDGVCRLAGLRRHSDAIIGAVMLVVVALASWLVCHWFPGRAAFLLMGAMIATAMSANVLFWIIPGQRKVVAALRRGEPIDPVHGLRGKQRSVHNTYFTLPVLFAMLSNHYSFLHSARHNAVVLFLMMLAGALIRQFFVLRHGYKLGRNGHPWPYAAVGVVIIAALVAWLAPSGTAPTPTAQLPVGYAQLQPVLAARCYACHGSAVQMKGVRLDSPEGVQAHAQAVYLQAVVARTMPLNNATGITDEERALIKRWFEGGALIQ